MMKKPVMVPVTPTSSQVMRGEYLRMFLASLWKELETAGQLYLELFFVFKFYWIWKSGLLLFVFFFVKFVFSSKRCETCRVCWLRVENMFNVLHYWVWWNVTYVRDSKSLSSCQVHHTTDLLNPNKQVMWLMKLIVKCFYPDFKM